MDLPDLDPVQETYAEGEVSGVNLSVTWPVHVTYLVIGLLTFACLYYNVREM